MIVYLHGFGSSGTSPKVDQLRARFGHARVIAPDLPFDPKEVCKKVEDIVRSVMLNRTFREPLIFVGTSLGGFYANYFGQLWDCPTVLVNPSIGPNQSLQSKLGANQNYATGEEFFVTLAHLQELESMTKRIDEIYSGNLINLFLARDDDVIPFQLALEKFKFPNTLTVTSDGGHRFDKNWTLVLDRIQEILKGLV